MQNVLIYIFCANLPGRNTRRNTRMLLSTPQRSWRSAQKGEIWKHGKGWQGSLWKRNENLHPPPTPAKETPKRNPKTPVHPRGLLQPSCSVRSISPNQRRTPWLIHWCCCKGTERDAEQHHCRWQAALPKRLPSWRRHTKRILLLMEIKQTPVQWKTG